MKYTIIALLCCLNVKFGTMIPVEYVPIHYVHHGQFGATIHHNKGHGLEGVATVDREIGVDYDQLHHRRHYYPHHTQHVIGGFGGGDGGSGGIEEEYEGFGGEGIEHYNKGIHHRYPQHGIVGFSGEGYEGIEKEVQHQHQHQHQLQHEQEHEHEHVLQHKLHQHQHEYEHQRGGLGEYGGGNIGESDEY